MRTASSLVTQVGLSDEHRLIRDAAIRDVLHRCAGRGILPSPSDALRESLGRSGDRWRLKNAVSALYSAAAPRRPLLASFPQDVQQQLSRAADSLAPLVAKAARTGAAVPQSALFNAAMSAGPPRPDWRRPAALQTLRAMAEAAADAVPAQTELVGADPSVPATRAELEIAAACATKYAPLIVQCARRGVPASQRSVVWFVTATTSGDSVAAETKPRESQAPQWIKADVKAHAGNSVEYFPATEMVEELVAGLEADPLARATAPPDAAGGLRLFPASGLTLIACPLFFVFSSTSRAFFWKLQALTDDGEGIACLLGVFDELAQQHAPRAVQHMAKGPGTAHALAFRWMQSAFAGALPVREVMLVWDRILAFGTLLVLPVLAAAILARKEEQICAAGSSKELKALFETLEDIDTTALLREMIARIL
eukprot:m51a1_g11369 hypothetical protein (425) ;mRNA; f:4731-6330